MERLKYLCVRPHCRRCRRCRRFIYRSFDNSRSEQREEVSLFAAWLTRDAIPESSIQDYEAYHLVKTQHRIRWRSSTQETTVSRK